jgi:hypothetical protein
MKILFTKKQFRDLLHALYMADWMSNAICEDDMKQDEGIKKIRNYIFSFAKDFGFEEYVEHDKEMNEYYATFTLDDDPRVRGLIERYDEHTFWEEAVEILGKRDFFERYTKKDWDKMTNEERREKMWQCEAVWGEEFEKFGIDRVRIVDRKLEARKDDKLP